MLHAIVGYHQDEEGYWVAELSCLHRQHIRHQPPFQDRAWVLDEAERDARTGSSIHCPLCDAAELPSDLALARTEGPFDEVTMPLGLRKAHHLGEGTWAVVCVLSGSADLILELEPPMKIHLRAAGRQPIPPLVRHLLQVDGSVRFAIEFWVAS